VLAKIAAYANAGVDPAIMGIATGLGNPALLSKAGWQISDLESDRGQ